MYPSTDLTTKSGIVQKRIYIGLMLIPLSIYLWVFLKYSVDMPAGDDYDAVLNWLHTFLVTSGVKERLLLLLEAHNEHRIVFDHLIFLGNYLALGRVNFIYLDLVGAAGLALIFWITLKLARDCGLSIFHLVPVAFLIFNLRQWELVSFSMASIQQYWQLFFSLLSIYKLHQSRGDKIGVSALFAVIASFTGGGGILVFPVGLLYLAYFKKWRHVLAWLTICLVTLYIYFIVLDYKSSPISQGSRELARHDYLLVIKYALAFMASYVRNVYFAIVLGGTTLLMCVYIIMKELAKRGMGEGMLIATMTAYVGMVAGAGSVSRISMGIDEALSSRYTIYSLVLVSLIYMYFAKQIRRPVWNNVYSIISSIAAVTLYCCYFGSSVDFLNYEHKLLGRYIVYPYNGRAVEILDTSMREGLFFPSAIVFHNLPESVKDNQGYKYAAAYTTSGVIPIPRGIDALVRGNVSYFGSWQMLSAEYLSRMDLKLAFPLNTKSSNADFLQWAVHSDNFGQRDRENYKSMLNQLEAAETSGGQ